MKSPYNGKFRVTQIYKGKNHKGIDLVGVDSKNLYAREDMKIEVAGWDNHPTGGMGHYVRGRGKSSNKLYYFAHLSECYVNVGQIVKDGECIGLEGSTGHSTGSHCHYEIRETTSNTSFIDVSIFSGIPNKEGLFMQDTKETITDTTITIGNTVVKAIIIDGVTYAPIRQIINTIKTELEVTWNKTDGAKVDL